MYTGTLIIVCLLDDEHLAVFLPVNPLLTLIDSSAVYERVSVDFKAMHKETLKRTYETIYLPNQELIKGLRAGLVNVL